jgi:hypothetical protein
MMERQPVSGEPKQPQFLWGVCQNLRTLKIQYFSGFDLVVLVVQKTLRQSQYENETTLENSMRQSKASRLR